MASEQKKSIQEGEKDQRKERWVLVSGGFDPIHIGHVRMFEAAKKLGDKLVVVMNNDQLDTLEEGFRLYAREGTR